MDIVLFYLNKTKSLLINKLNYDTKVDIYLNFDYYNLPRTLKYDPCFLSKLIEKRLHSKFKYYETI